MVSADLRVSHLLLLQKKKIQCKKTKIAASSQVIGHDVPNCSPN